MFNNKRKAENTAQIVFRSPNQQVRETSSEPVFPKRKSVSRSFIALLSVIFLVAVAAYFWYAGEDKEGNLLSTTKPIKPNTTSYSQSQGESISQRDSLLSGINNAETTQGNHTDPTTSAYANSAGTSTEQVKNNTQNASSQTTRTSNYTHANSSNTDKQEAKEPATVKTQYKVLSKAHFYSQPNQNFRLPNSINHWKSSYAPLNALDEKNGFIYAVFTDDQNKTSEGWLRKKDVKPVKTIMYASDGK